jgi:hypothetical protein
LISKFYLICGVKLESMKNRGWPVNACNAPLTKLVYLVDLETVRRYGRQVSNITWVRDHYGPFVWDILDTAENSPERFRVRTYSGNKRYIELISRDTGIIEPWVEGVVDNVIASAPDPHRFQPFLNFVYDTAPMALSTGLGPLCISEAIDAEKDVEATLGMIDTPEWDEAMEWLEHH